MDFEAAARRGVQRLKKGPVAVAGRYDQQAGRVVIELDSGLEIAFKPQQAQGLESATPANLNEIEISPSGQDVKRYVQGAASDEGACAAAGEGTGRSDRNATNDESGNQ